MKTQDSFQSAIESIRNGSSERGQWGISWMDPTRSKNWCQSGKRSGWKRQKYSARSRHDRGKENERWKKVWRRVFKYILVFSKGNDCIQLFSSIPLKSGSSYIRKSRNLFEVDRPAVDRQMVKGRSCDDDWPRVDRRRSRAKADWPKVDHRADRAKAGWPRGNRARADRGTADGEECYKQLVLGKGKNDWSVRRIKRRFRLVVRLIAKEWYRIHSAIYPSYLQPSGIHLLQSRPWPLSLNRIITRIDPSAIRKVCWIIYLAPGHLDLCPFGRVPCHLAGLCLNPKSRHWRPGNFSWSPPLPSSGWNVLKLELHRRGRACCVQLAMPLATDLLPYGGFVAPSSEKG